MCPDDGKSSIWAHNLLINAHDEVVGQRQEASPNNYFSSLLGNENSTRFVPLVSWAGKLGQRSISNCDKCFSIYAADIDFDPIIALAVEHEGTIGWHPGTLHRRARLAIFEIPNDVDIVNFEVLACQDGDGREQAWKDALHAL